MLESGVLHDRADGIISSKLVADCAVVLACRRGLLEFQDFSWPRVMRMQSYAVH